MLQQTRVDKVLDYFARFMARFPDVASLACAPQDEVLALWSGLGYYSRARNMHRAAQIIVAEHGGRVPDDEKDLRALPGIGPYTAGAILSIAFDQAVPLVDGNVERVLARLMGIREDPRDPMPKKRILAAAATLVKGLRPGDLNQALMELGALLCKPGLPDCAHCPAQKKCQAYRLHMQNEIPVARKKTAQPRLRMAVAVVVDQERVLLRRRPDSGLFAGLWELPSVGIKAGARRAQIGLVLQRSLGISLQLGRKLAGVERLLTHRRLQIEAYQVSLSEPPVESQNLRFVSLEKLENQALSSAMRVLLKKLKLK